jgi:hypothetical protein
MFTQAISDPTGYAGELEAQTSSVVETADFIAHARVLALQTKITSKELLEYFDPSHKGVISHW